MEIHEMREQLERREIAAKAAHRAFKADDIDTHSRNAWGAAAATSSVLEGVVDRLEEIEQDQRAASRTEALRTVAGMTNTQSRVLLPTLKEFRAALAESSDAVGGIFVPQQQASVWLDTIRSESVFLRALGALGGRIIEMTSDTMVVPQIASATSTGFFNEAQTLSSTEMTFAGITCTARKMGCYSLISSEALQDSSPSLREVVSFDFVTQMSRGLDAALLAGSGTPPTPRGARNWTSATVTHADTNGASLSLSMITDAITRHLTAGGDLSSSCLFMHPKIWGQIKQMSDDSGQYLLHPEISAPADLRLFGLPVYLSDQISTTEACGSSGNVTTYLLLIDMKHAPVVARRQEVQLQFSTDVAFASDQVGIRAISRWDLQAAQPTLCQVVDGLL